MTTQQENQPPDGEPCPTCGGWGRITTEGGTKAACPAGPAAHGLYGFLRETASPFWGDDAKGSDQQ